MAILEIEAQNISGSSTPFLLLGLRRKSPPQAPDPDLGLVAVEFTTPDDWEVVVKLGHPSVAAGEILHERPEFDFDLAALRWHVPFKYQGRFVLRRFVFDGRPLLEKAGVI